MSSYTAQYPGSLPAESDLLTPENEDVSSALANDITDVSPADAGNLEVDDASNFSGNGGVVRIASTGELIQFSGTNTGATPDQLTGIDRGFAGTTAAAATTGDRVDEVVTAEHPARLAKELVAIATELGADPAGSLSDVVTWLQTEHNADGTHGSITATGLAVANNADALFQVDIKGGATASQNTDLRFLDYDDSAEWVFRKSFANYMTIRDASNVIVSLQPGSPANSFVLTAGGVAINRPSSSAQLHVVSGDAARVGLRVDTAASPSADLLQLTQDGTEKLSVTKDGALSLVVLETGAELTVSSGAITITNSLHTVDTESDAASDDLDTINGGVDGMRLILRAANSARDVVVKHNTGNILLDGSTDFTLDTVWDQIELIYRASGTSWLEISRSNNA